MEAVEQATVVQVGKVQDLLRKLQEVQHMVMLTNLCTPEVVLEQHKLATPRVAVGWCTSML